MSFTDISCPQGRELATTEHMTASEETSARYAEHVGRCVICRREN